MSQFRTDRSLMLEQDPEKVQESMGPLTSIRQADWRHQKAAMMHGYNSMVEYAIDELLKQMGELHSRLDRLEHQLSGLQGGFVIENGD